MDEISTSRRVTRASVAAMEMETSTKFNNDPVPLNIIPHEPRAKSIKRKQGSKNLEEKINGGKKKKKECSSEKEGQRSTNEEIAYYVLNRPIDAPHMQVYTNHNVFRDLKQKLSHVQFNKFKDTCFGIYACMHQCFVQAQIFRCFMACELVDSAPDALLISINHSTLRFSLREFAIIPPINPLVA